MGRRRYGHSHVTGRLALWGQGLIALVPWYLWSLDQSTEYESERHLCLGIY